MNNSVKIVFTREKQDLTRRHTYMRFDLAEDRSEVIIFLRKCGFLSEKARMTTSYTKLKDKPTQT